MNFTSFYPPSVPPLRRLKSAGLQGGRKKKRPAGLAGEAGLHQGMEDKGIAAPAEERQGAKSKK